MQSLATSIGLALFGVAVRRSPAPLRLAAIVASAGLAYDALTHRKRGPFDQTVSLMREPYRFIGAECRRRGVSTFETRVMLERTVCMRGAQAASLFYDGTRMRREGAAPEPLRATLFGNGGVQTLDDYAHRHRKALFLAVTTPERVAALARRANVEWEHAIDRWTTRRSIALYPEVQAVLARAVCAWAGVPLDVDGIKARTAQFAALFDDAARGAIEHLHARYARKRLEHWLARLIDDHREGRARFPHGTVAEDVARHTDGYGDPLPAHIAAVELLNILRPTVAVSVYVTFVAHALATRPTCRARLAEGDPRYLDAFVQEVRRWYPFFPSAMARARRDFGWNGLDFAAGERVILDLYGTNHDARIWGDPHAFRPERFLDHTPGPFEFVPQGGGRVEDGHRCPGEGIAVALMKEAVDVLVHRIDYAVPRQSLRLRMHRLPALPVEGFRMRDIRRRAPARPA